MPTDGLSVVPMVVLAAALAAGLNGFLSLIELYRYSPTFQEVSQMQFDTPLWLGILSFGILAPLGEEFVFRGVVYGRLKKVSNVPVAVVVSALLFGLFHGNLVQASMPRSWASCWRSYMRSTTASWRLYCFTQWRICSFT